MTSSSQARAAVRQPKARDAARLLSSAEARAQLGIGETKFYELVATGALAVVRIPSPAGRRRELRVEPAEIDAFIARNRTARRSA